MEGHIPVIHVLKSRPITVHILGHAVAHQQQLIVALVVVAFLKPTNVQFARLANSKTFMETKTVGTSHPIL